MLTMWPEPCLSIFGRSPLRDVEEAGEIGRELGVEVLGRVVGEGLGDEDAGIVDQRVDPPEPRDRLPNDALGGRRIADVAADRQDVLSRRSARSSGRSPRPGSRDRGTPRPGRRRCPATHR